MATSSRMNIDDVLAFLSGGTVSDIGLSNELAQLDDTEMNSDANSTDNSEQQSSDEEENGAVESLLTTAYSMQQSSAMVESPAEHSSLLLLDPEINSGFDGKQYSLDTTQAK